MYNRIIELDYSLKEFVEEVRNIVPPQWGELKRLRYQVLEGNLYARERMIKMHLRLALKLALQRSEMYEMNIQDAVSEACIGLIIAVDRYDSDVNGAFSAYASMWILQNLVRNQPMRNLLIYYPVHKRDFFFSTYGVLKDCGFFYDSNSIELEKVKSILQQSFSISDEECNEVIQAVTPFISYEEIRHNYRETKHTFEKYDHNRQSIVRLGKKNWF